MANMENKTNTPEQPSDQIQEAVDTFDFSRSVAASRRHVEVTDTDPTEPEPIAVRHPRANKVAATVGIATALGIGFVAGDAVMNGLEHQAVVNEQIGSEEIQEQFDLELRMAQDGQITVDVSDEEQK